MRGVPFLLVIVIGLSPAVHAQSIPDSGKGLIWYEGLTGTYSFLGTVSRLAAGYTHSASFSLDTVYFGVGVNLAKFFGSSSH